MTASYSCPLSSKPAGALVSRMTYVPTGSSGESASPFASVVSSRDTPNSLLDTSKTAPFSL